MRRQPNWPVVALIPRARASSANLGERSSAPLKPRLLLSTITWSGHCWSSVRLPSTSACSSSRFRLSQSTVSVLGCLPSAFRYARSFASATSRCGTSSAASKPGHAIASARSVRMAITSAVIRPMSRSASPPLPSVSNTSTRPLPPGSSAAWCTRAYASCHAVPHVSRSRSSSGQVDVAWPDDAE